MWQCSGWKKGTNDFKRNAELLKGNILNNSLTPL
jgi:hypothetical protein